MSSMVASANRITAMPPAAIDRVRRLEEEVMRLPQEALVTKHYFHAGMYARTICIPAGCVLTGALIKIATLLIIDGDASVYIGDGSQRLVGHNTLMADAGRKQAFMAHANTYVTMIFPSHAQTVEEAEAEFTEEHEMLMSRHNPNEVFISQVQS